MIGDHSKYDAFYTFVIPPKLKAIKAGIKWCPGCSQPMYNSNCWCSSCHKEVVDRMHNRPKPPYNPPIEDITTCTLHVFFIGIPETDQHLEMLRKVEPVGDEPKHAKSKITESNLASIEPVNRVAARGMRGT